MFLSIETWIGFGGATLTTLSFVPQVAKAWRTRSTHDLSRGWLAAFFSGVVLWLVYGLLLANPVIVASNAVTLVLIASLLYLKWRYG